MQLLKEKGEEEKFSSCFWLLFDFWYGWILFLERKSFLFGFPKNLSAVIQFLKLKNQSFIKKSLQNLLLQNQKKSKKAKDFPSFLISIRRKTKPNKKEFFFFFILLLNITFKPTRFKDLNFQAKNKSKRWTPSEGKSILHQHLFLLLSLLFFLFCLISYLIQFIFIFVLIIY